MTPAHVPWLWLFGASGAGKSAAGFELYRQLGAEGRRVAFLDLDQIGMCLPDNDPIRAPIKTANLQSVLRNLAAVGAEGVVVAGDVSGAPMQRILDMRGQGHPPDLPGDIRYATNHGHDWRRSPGQRRQPLYAARPFQPPATSQPTVGTQAPSPTRSRSGRSLTSAGRRWAPPCGPPRPG